MRLPRRVFKCPGYASYQQPARHASEVFAQEALQVPTRRDFPRSDNKDLSFVYSASHRETVLKTLSAAAAVSTQD
jgi:hypothetical protein